MLENTETMESFMGSFGIVPMTTLKDEGLLSVANCKKRILDMLKYNKGNSVVSFEYLFANPRKEVVKWALKHKEELGLSKVAREFIEEYQAIPELKELILNTLEKKGE